MSRTKVPGNFRKLYADLTTVEASPGGSVSWASVTGKPSTFTPSSHDHSTSDVTGLDTALSGKANTSHTHPTSAITGLDAALSGKASTSHTHATSEVTGLDTALSGKQATLVSATNIKTINGSSVLGSGDLVVSGGGGGGSPILSWII